MDESFKRTKDFIKEAHAAGKKVVLIKGVFDLLHPDHIRCFEYLKSKADILVVLIIGDKATSKIKPGRPIQDEISRIRIISSLRVADFCDLDYDSIDPQTEEYSREIDVEKIKALAPDLWVVSEGRKAKFIGYDLGEINLIEVPEGTEFSTTKIIRKILDTYSGDKPR